MPASIEPEIVTSGKGYDPPLSVCVPGIQFIELCLVKLLQAGHPR